MYNFGRPWDNSPRAAVCYNAACLNESVEDDRFISAGSMFIKPCTKALISIAASLEYSTLIFLGVLKCLACMYNDNTII